MEESFEFTWKQIENKMLLDKNIDELKSGYLYLIYTANIGLKEFLLREFFRE
jgi:hypothetical protein